MHRRRVGLEIEIEDQRSFDGVAPDVICDAGKLAQRGCIRLIETQRQRLAVHVVNDDIDIAGGAFDAIRRNGGIVPIQKDGFEDVSVEHHVLKRIDPFTGIEVVP
jgi:hypothetical protein